MENLSIKNRLLNEGRFSISDMFFNYGGVQLGEDTVVYGDSHIKECAERFINVWHLDDVTPDMLVNDFIERL